MVHCIGSLKSSSIQKILKLHKLHQSIIACDISSEEDLEDLKHMLVVTKHDWTLIETARDVPSLMKIHLFYKTPGMSLDKCILQNTRNESG